MPAIMHLSDLKGERIGLCVSGGLDSRTVAKRLKEEGVDVICFTADLDQPDEPDISAVREKMAPCGVETVSVDLKTEMAAACFMLIQAQATYDGGYWNTTGVARAVTVRGLLNAMLKRGCTVLAHGATGRGNDQMRFERYTNMLAPEFKVYAPWRDPVLLRQFPGRTQMAEYLNQFGIPASLGGPKRYSTDANLAGLSHEAEDLESLETSCLIVAPKMGVWPQQAPDAVEDADVRFEKGVPTHLNGKELSPLQLMRAANQIGGRNGIGIKNALESRIIGTKSRGVYEAPGLELLGRCLEMVYQAVWDRRSLDLFAQLSRLIGRQVYDGRYFDLSTQSALSGVSALSRVATGTVRAGLYKGNIFFKSLTECPSSLYNEDDSSMEESKGLNPVSSQGFAEIQSVEALAMARAHHLKPLS